MRFKTNLIEPRTIKAYTDGQVPKKRAHVAENYKTRRGVKVSPSVA